MGTGDCWANPTKCKGIRQALYLRERERKNGGMDEKGLGQGFLIARAAPSNSSHPNTFASQSLASCSLREFERETD